MARDGAMRGFGLHDFAVGAQQNRGHQPQRPIPLSHNIGLNIAVIVLTRPDKAASIAQSLSDHIVNQAMLVEQALFLKILLEFLLVDGLEQIFEAPVIGFQNGVFGG